MNEPLPATCPKCSSPRAPAAVECPSCGIIYARFQRRPQPEARAAALPAPGLPTASESGPAPGGYVPARRVETALTLLAQALESGLSLTVFLLGPGATLLPPAHQRRLQSDVQAGLSLAESLGTLEILDPGSLALVKAGERHGRLPESLHQVAERLAERRKDRDRMVLALLYPSLLFLAGALLLPLPTLISRGPVAYLGEALPLIVGLAALAAFALLVLPRLQPSSPLRQSLRALGAAMPISGSVIWSGAVANFADVLGSCLRAGLPALESVSLAGRAAAHPRFDQGMPQVLARIEAGATLAEALNAIRGLDATFFTQVNAGERSGTLDKILPKVAADWRRRARMAALVLVGALGALAFLAVLGLLAFEVIQGWQKVFETRSGAIDQLMGQ